MIISLVKILKLLLSIYFVGMSSRPLVRLSSTITPSKTSSNRNWIFLHGLLGSKRNFYSLSKTKQVSKRANIHLLDLRNHGDSDHTKTHSIKDCAADLAGYLSTANISEAYVLGHSMGGKIAMQLALEYPDLVKGLVVVDIGPYNYTDSTRFGNFTSNMIYLKGMNEMKLNGSSKEKLFKDLLEVTNNNENLAKFFMTNLVPSSENPDEMKWRINLETLIRDYHLTVDQVPESGLEYTGPIKVIAGEKSPYVPREHLEDFLENFPFINLEKDVSYLNCGHWVHSEKPKDFVNLFEKIDNDFFELEQRG